MISLIEKEWEDHLGVIKEVKSLSPQIVDFAKKLIDVLNSKGKVLIFGNGGSAASAQHFVSELLGRFVGKGMGWYCINSGYGPAERIGQ